MLPRRVDVRDGNGIGSRKRPSELGREMLRARVEMRLEQDQNPARIDLAGGCERRGDLRRVMCIVVVDPDAARLPAELEATRHAAVLGDVRSRGV